MNQKVMIILSSIPGSGKSTLAKILANGLGNCVICSTDDFFMIDGKYCFDYRLAKENHDKNFQKTLNAMAEGKNVIIDNTNTNKKQYGRYEEAAIENGFTVHHIYLKPDPETSYVRNVHEVPKETIDNMANLLIKDFGENKPKDKDGDNKFNDFGETIEINGKKAVLD